MSNMNTIKMALAITKATAAASLETAKPVNMMEYPIDTSDMTYEEKLLTATLTRLHRICDNKYERVKNEALSYLSSIKNAEQLILSYDEDNILSLNLSYEATSKLCGEIVAKLKRMGIEPSDTLIAFSEGSFPIERELDSIIE